MKTLTLVFLCMAISLISFSQELPAGKIIGTWESTDTDPKLRFEFFEKDSKYFGRLIWASNMYEDDGKTPKKDFNNPDKKLQSRSRKGIVNITDLTYEKGEYTDGKLYNPSDGRTYSVKGKLTSADKLDFRGYLGVSLFGKTMKFKRIK